jgi:hypothetical protein
MPPLLGSKMLDKCCTAPVIAKLKFDVLTVELDVLEVELSVSCARAAIAGV